MPILAFDFAHNPVGSVIYVVLLLILAVISIYYFRRSKQGEAQAVTIAAQSETIDALDKRMQIIADNAKELQNQLTKATEKIDEATRKMDELLKENDRLTQILADRDKATADLRTAQWLAIQQINTMYEAMIIKKGRRSVVGN